MTQTISQRELRNDSAKIMDAVVAGDEFVVTRNGTPVAELKPLKTSRSRFVPRASLAVVAAAGPHLDPNRFRSDLDLIADQAL
jgi:prevent-host-death family protein